MIRFRRNSAAAASTSNPVLASGEPGFATDTGDLRIGDGASAWDALPDTHRMLDRASASSTYAPQNTGRPSSGLVAAIGDSITAWNGNGSPLRQRATWFQQLCARSKQRIRYGGVYATASYTLTQIRDTHLPTVLALDPRPAACIVQGVTNDMASGFDQATSFAVIEDICQQLMAAGIRPVLMLAPPRGDSADADVARWNVRLRRYADQIGALVLDAHTPLLSTTTGARNASLYEDTTHPTWSGHTAMAQRGITDDLAGHFPAQRVTCKSSSDAANLIPSGYGLFATDSNADGLADGWTSPATSVTKSRPTPVAADDLIGNWQQAVRSPGGSLSTVLQLATDISTGFSAGDRLAFSGRFQASGVAGTGTMYSIQVAWQGVTAQNLEAVYNWDVDIDDGAWYVEGVVPAGTTALRVQVLANAPTSGTPTIRVGEVTLRNLTTAGAA